MIEKLENRNSWRQYLAEYCLKYQSFGLYEDAEQDWGNGKPSLRSTYRNPPPSRHASEYVNPTPEYHVFFSGGVFESNRQDFNDLPPQILHNRFERGPLHRHPYGSDEDEHVYIDRTTASGTGPMYSLRRASHSLRNKRKWRRNPLYYIGSPTRF